MKVKEFDEKFASVSAENTATYTYGQTGDKQASVLFDYTEGKVYIKYEKDGRTKVTEVKKLARDEKNTNSVAFINGNKDLPFIKLENVALLDSIADCLKTADAETIAQAARDAQQAARAAASAATGKGGAFHISSEEYAKKQDAKQAARLDRVGGIEVVAEARKKALIENGKAFKTAVKTLEEQKGNEIKTLEDQLAELNGYLAAALGQNVQDQSQITDLRSQIADLSKQLEREQKGRKKVDERLRDRRAVLKQREELIVEQQNQISNAAEERNNAVNAAVARAEDEKTEAVNTAVQNANAANRRKHKKIYVALALAVVVVAAAVAVVWYWSASKDKEEIDNLNNTVASKTDENDSLTNENSDLQNQVDDATAAAEQAKADAEAAAAEASAVTAAQEQGKTDAATAVSKMLETQTSSAQTLSAKLTDNEVETGSILNSDGSVNADVVKAAIQATCNYTSDYSSATAAYYESYFTALGTNMGTEIANELDSDDLLEFLMDNVLTYDANGNLAKENGQLKLSDTFVQSVVDVVKEAAGENYNSGFEGFSSALATQIASNIAGTTISKTDTTDPSEDPSEPAEEEDIIKSEAVVSALSTLLAGEEITDTFRDNNTIYAVTDSSLYKITVAYEISDLNSSTLAQALGKSTTNVEEYKSLDTVDGLKSERISQYQANVTELGDTSVGLYYSVSAVANTANKANVTIYNLLDDKTIEQKDYFVSTTNASIDLGKAVVSVITTGAGGSITNYTAREVTSDNTATAASYAFVTDEGTYKVEPTKTL